MLAVLLPWAISLPLVNMPTFLGYLMNLSSLVFVGVADFLVPCVIYRMMIRDAELVQVPGGHAAFPVRLGLRRRHKELLAIGVAGILGTAAFVAFAITLRDGFTHVTFSLAACAEGDSSRLRL